MLVSLFLSWVRNLLYWYSVFILTSTLRYNEEQPRSTLVVWDIQTGVTMKEAKNDHYGMILFYGDQSIATLVRMQPSIQEGNFYLYDTFNGTLLFQDRIVPSQGSGFGAHWTHDSALQFATSFERGGRLVINIYELQQILTSPPHKLSSFSVPPQTGRFSFSPISFHASFVTDTKVVILDVQNARLLLHTEVAQIVQSSGQFSFDGCFFAYQISEYEIHIWQNTSTGYVPWNSLTSRLSVKEFLWSPTSDSILCWCSGGMLLLHPGNHPDPLSLDKEPSGHHGDHVVVCPADCAYIAMAQRGKGVITVIDSLSGTTQWVIDTGMEIQEVKMTNNTLYVVDAHKLVSWYLGAGGSVPGVHETLAIGANARKLTLSYDCTQIAFMREWKTVSLYDIKGQKILKSFEWGEDRPSQIQFSPDGHQLWCVGSLWSSTGGPLVMKLNTAEDWNSIEVISKKAEDYSSWTNIFSPNGYHVGMGTVWVMDYGGRKILWLPPHWRVRVKWEGNFIASVDHDLPAPIVIEFQP